MDSPLLLSIQVGLPRQMQMHDSGKDKEKVWRSAIYKEQVEGPLWLDGLNLAGDKQSDLRVHGGPDRAVLGYSAEHYAVWREELERPELTYGSFGENFTISGLSEETAYIGDIYQLGEVQLQVSQPRQPCWKLELRIGVEDMISRVHKRVWGGWYFRVLKQGYVEPKQPLTLLERPCPQWTVKRAYTIMTKRRKDQSALRELVACPYLSADWHRYLTERLQAVEEEG